MIRSGKKFGSAIEFSSFGKSTIAYMRRVPHEELPPHLAENEGLDEFDELWGLFGADGEPLALADEQSLLLADADAHNLVAVQRH